MVIKWTLTLLLQVLFSLLLIPSFLLYKVITKISWGKKFKLYVACLLVILYLIFMMRLMAKKVKDQILLEGSEDFKDYNIVTIILNISDLTS